MADKEKVKMQNDFLQKKISEIYGRFEKLEAQITSLEHVMSVASEGIRGAGTTEKINSVQKDHYDMEILGMKIKLDNALAEIKSSISEVDSKVSMLEARLACQDSTPSENRISDNDADLGAELEARIHEIVAKTSKSVLMINAKMDYEIQELRKRIEKVEQDLPQ